MKRQFLILLMAVVLGSLLSSCNDDGPREAGLSLMKTTHPKPISLKDDSQKENELVNDIERDVENFKELYDVSVIRGKNDVLVAYKVKHLERFHMKKIEKKITKLLEKNYPDENFTISSDYKIFLEAVELEENLKNPNYSKKKAEKKLQDIIKLKKELT